MAEKGYVFISYSSKDGLFVQKMIDAMEHNNIPYWKAPEMIPAGSNYAKEIPKAICDCDIFLLILSKTSQSSIWVEKEIDLAICYRKTIIPVQIDEEPLNDLYRFYLNNVQMISISLKPNQIPDFTKIQEQIRKLLAVKNGTEGKLQVHDENKPESDNKNQENSRGKLQKYSQNLTKRSNALRMNRIPHECEFCGGEVGQDSVGIYLCAKCGRENYDDFQKVRNYLEKAGAAPAAVIARNTGVPMKTIDYFWKEELLEIPSTLDVRLACQKCGAPIRTGYLCDACKWISNKSFGKKG